MAVNLCYKIQHPDSAHYLCHAETSTGISASGCRHFEPIDFGQKTACKHVLMQGQCASQDARDEADLDRREWFFPGSGCHHE